MKSSFRKSYVLGRFGGEEFIIISGSEEEVVFAKMNEFREKLSNTPIALTTDTNISLTVSISLSSLEKADKNFFSLVKAADTVLYQTKNSGRNIVCVY